LPVEVASWATEGGRGAQLGSPSLPNALGDLLIHHPLTTDPLPTPACLPTMIPQRTRVSLVAG
jgi:hypothetical protein